MQISRLKKPSRTAGVVFSCLLDKSPFPETAIRRIADYDVIQNFYLKYFTGGDEPLPLSGYMANKLKKYRASVGNERGSLLYDGKLVVRRFFILFLPCSE